MSKTVNDLTDAQSKLDSAVDTLAANLLKSGHVPSAALDAAIAAIDAATVAVQKVQ
jgi:hypothetical protein